MKTNVAKLLRIAWITATGSLLVWFLILPLGARAGLDLNVQFLHGVDASDHSLTPRPGSELTGNWNVAVRATSLSSLKNVSLAIQPDLSANIVPALGTEAFKNESVPLGTQVKELTLPWDTASLTPYNGIYQIIATADSLLERETATIGSLKVNNPPAVPKQVDARLADGLPLVTWAPNTEPDIVGYAVFRYEAASLAFQTSVTGPVFKDDDAPAGVPLRYEVAAVRKSPVNPKGIASQKSLRTPTIALPLQDQDAPMTAASLPESKVEQPAQVEVEVKDKVGPSRAVGFETLLPYSEIPMTSNETIPPPLEFEETLAVPAPSTQQLPAVDPVKHIAGAMALLVAAMHLARFSRVVLKARP